MVTIHSLGFPRIGSHREMKTAVEGYWNEKISMEELTKAGSRIRNENWGMESALDLMPVGDFSWYDHVLDMSALLGVVPPRFEHSKGEVDINTYFLMARGRAPKRQDVIACEMTKWFDTNYHYIVPELSKHQEFKLSSQKLFQEVNEAKALGYKVKPVIVGPLTYLWLAKEKGGSFNKLDLLKSFIPVYIEILTNLRNQGVEWVQIDEPILTQDLTEEWKSAFTTTYEKLKINGLKILLTTYFGSLEENTSLACSLPVAGLHIDCVRAPEQLKDVLKVLPDDKILSVGIVDGRNIWRCDIQKAIDILKPVYKKLNSRLWIAGSCSFLHCPVDLTYENQLDPEIKGWLAFTKQKIEELQLIAKGLTKGENSIIHELQECQKAMLSRKTSTKIHNENVKKRTGELSEKMTVRSKAHRDRYQLQHQNLQLPLFPTTTIGSFPQTPEIRSVRHDYKKGIIDQNQYEDSLRKEIADVIKRQELIGLDVLVHGEPERNDMVEYFGELLEGFAFTLNGWVQSYGSRCVKPPVIYGDVSRPRPMSVDWSRYAQSLSKKPVKGMLTGPITMLCWSFVRDDQPRTETAKQIALAIRDEVSDLEAAGIGIIQIDEPALREGLPLRVKDRKSYLENAVYCFKIASCGVKDDTQIHVHMCYSEFHDIIEPIAALDADVISIETSRSDMDLLKTFETFEYPNEIGPGVYDIHSPRIPTVEEIINLLEKASQFIPVDRLWVNPDCGLKTRRWPETEQSLKNMVTAARHMRTKYALQESSTKNL